MKLQLALDTFTLEESIELLNQVNEYIDIIEVGTPFIIEDGLIPVRKFKELYPNCEVLADVKIMDGGEYEAEKCFNAGADIATVLGAAHNETILGTIKAARKYNKKIMVDMINVKDIRLRVKEIDEMGVDYICVHTAFDVQNSGANPLEELKIINDILINAKSAVAGGLKLATIPTVVKEGAEIIVVGGGISNAKDKIKMCQDIKELMKK